MEPSIDEVADIRLSIASSHMACLATTKAIPPKHPTRATNRKNIQLVMSRENLKIELGRLERTNGHSNRNHTGDA